MIDATLVSRLAKKIQRKHFQGQSNYNVIGVCCLLLADEILNAEAPNQYELLDDLVAQIKKFLANNTTPLTKQ